MFTPNNGTLLNINGRTAQWMAHARETEIPMASVSNLNLWFM
jgi:hypothetical protein